MIDTQIWIRRGLGIARIGGIAAALTAPLGAISCEKLNPYWCPGHPHNDCRLEASPGDGDGGPDGGAGCTHEQCTESNACLPDGACAAATDVAYVRGGATGAACTKVDPCGTLAQALATLRPVVKVSGTVREPNPVSIARNVIILADTGAEIMASRDGDLVDIDADKVDIYDLGFAGVMKATGPANAAISVEGLESVVTLIRVTIHDNIGQGAAMSAGSQHGVLTLVASKVRKNGDGIFSEGSTQGGRKTIAVTDCVIEENDTGIVVNNSDDVTLVLARSKVSLNGDGGIYMTDGKYKIVGNVISNNGNPGGSVGGIRIEAPFAATNRLEFNTIYGNQVTEGPGSAIHCNPPSFTARNNIVFQNTTSPTSDQIGGSCHHSYSFLPPDSSGADGDQNVIGSNPMFKDPVNGDFHLAPGSQALGKGDPAFIRDELSQLDLDGQQRGNPPDIGADEAP